MAGLAPKTRRDRSPSPDHRKPCDVAKVAIESDRVPASSLASGLTNQLVGEVSLSGTPGAQSRAHERVSLNHELCGAENLFQMSGDLRFGLAVQARQDPYEFAQNHGGDEKRLL